MTTKEGNSKGQSRDGHGSKDSGAVPLDALLIFFSSICLLLILLWAASVLRGKPAFEDVPAPLKSVVSNFWTKVIAASGTGALGLWKLINKKRGPNYLLWIPGCTVFWIGLLFLLVHLFPSTPPANPLIQATAHFTLEPLEATKNATTSDNEILFRASSPRRKNPVGLFPLPNEANGYSSDIEIPTFDGFNFVADINHRVLVSHAKGYSKAYEYEICLEPNSGHSVPSGASKVQVRVACAKTGQCIPAKDDPGYATACENVTRREFSSVVYAAENRSATRAPGWVVPSLETLARSNDRDRVGYTRFDLDFVPPEQLKNADHYFYSVRVNGTPIYIDGFLPDQTTYPLTPGANNHFSFALENLAFRGEHDGYEQLSLTITFLAGDKPAQSPVSLTRTYVALRDAAPEQTNTQVGTFTWTGKYIAPKNENRYNIILESSPDLNRLNKERERLDATFARDKMTFTGQSVSLAGPIVTVMRPPRYTASYGLGLGVVLPTQQVQFTFNTDEAKEFCHWVAENVGNGKIIQPSPMRYDSATRNGPTCQ